MSDNIDKLRKAARKKFDDFVDESTEKIKIEFKLSKLVFPDVEDEKIEKFKQYSGIDVANSIIRNPTVKENESLSADIIIEEGLQARVFRLWGNKDPIREWKNKI